MSRHHVHDPWCGCPPDGWRGPSIGEPDWFGYPVGPGPEQPARTPYDAALEEHVAQLQARVRELEEALAERSASGRRQPPRGGRVPARRR